MGFIPFKIENGKNWFKKSQKAALGYKYLAMINNSTIIDLYDDMLLKSYQFEDCQTLDK